MLKVLRIVKGMSIFLVANIIGAIMLFYIEPIIFQESNLESMVQVLIIVGLFFVFLGGIVHMYLRSNAKLEEK